MNRANNTFDRQSIGSHLVTDILSDTGTQTGKSESLFSTTSGNKVHLHPMVAPFYSNLEVMDYLASQKMNVLVKRQDKSKVMHRDEREELRLRLNYRSVGKTPDLSSPNKLMTSIKSRISKQNMNETMQIFED